MARTRDLGRLFFAMLRLEPAPLIHIGTSQEIEPPFRRSRVVVFRLPFHRGLAVGWWRSSGLSEEEALIKAFHGYGFNLTEDELMDPEVRVKVRNTVARCTETIEDEWIIVSALGLDQ